jgi:ABC-type transporter Mla subunit MlaD
MRAPKGAGAKAEAEAATARMMADLTYFRGKLNYQIRSGASVLAGVGNKRDTCKHDIEMTEKALSSVDSFHQKLVINH